MKSKIFIYIASAIELWYALFAIVGSYRLWNEISRLRAGNLPGVQENATGLVILVLCALLLFLAAIGLLANQKWAFHLSSLISLLIIFLLVVGLIFSQGTLSRISLTLFNTVLPILLIFSLYHPQTRRNIFPEKYQNPDAGSAEKVQ